MNGSQHRVQSATLQAVANAGWWFVCLAGSFWKGVRLCVGQLSVYCDLKAKREPYSAGTFSVVPKGMDCAMPILDVKFHHKGNEAKAITTLYALILGTKNVWRRVDRRSEEGTPHNNWLKMITITAVLPIIEFRSTDTCTEVQFFSRRDCCVENK